MFEAFKQHGKNTLVKNVQCRITEKENEVLNNIAEYLNYTKSDIIRESIRYYIESKGLNKE